MKKAFYYNKNGSLSVLKIDGDLSPYVHPAMGRIL
jgi:hypothetical protein